jgi:DNA-binding NarL/FixJ family response regulator
MRNNVLSSSQLTRTKAGRIRWQSTSIQMVLARLSANGHSATEIAEYLDCRRDQVAGAMRRYGLFAVCRGMQ